MMGRIISIVVCLLLAAGARANIYLIIYATADGNTGHCGIAIDEYKVLVKEIVRDKTSDRYYDTVATGTVIYYDMWPAKDLYKGAYDIDTEPHYYRLPSRSYKDLISIKTISDQGLPHKLNYPCDGIISIPSTKDADMKLVAKLNDLMDANRPFNAMKNNCCDFAIQAISFLRKEKITAQEFIVKDYVTTPNELFHVVSSWPDVKIIKDPGKSVSGSFFEERILVRLMPLLKLF